MATLTTITQEDFTTVNGWPIQGAKPTFVMLFDNGQKIRCWGDQTKEQLTAKCEDYYLKHPAISAYAIHENPANISG